MNSNWEVLDLNKTESKITKLPKSKKNQNGKSYNNWQNQHIKRMETIVNDVSITKLNKTTLIWYLLRLLNFFIVCMLMSSLECDFVMLRWLHEM